MIRHTYAFLVMNVCSRKTGVTGAVSQPVNERPANLFAHSAAIRLIRTAVALLLLVRVALRAGVPEPDNVLYGTITLDNQPVTANRTDVVVEARRLIGGPAIARYPMGSSAQAGNFYSLRVSLESAQPLFDPNASLVGDSLFIVVLDGSGIRSQSIYTVGDRGAVQRLDFGAAVLDSDGDGLPDAWERLHLGSTSPTPNSINANGQTTLQNYVAGTNPNDTNSLFRVAVTASGANALFSFQALRAEGTGYEGLSRYYSLEYSTNAGAGLWLGLNNSTNLLGNNQTITYQPPGTNGPAFYRGRVWLQ